MNSVILFISIHIPVSQIFFSFFFFVEDFLEEFNENDGRMEMEENGKRKCDSLDDEPWHETEEISFNQIGSNLKYEDNH